MDGTEGVGPDCLLLLLELADTNRVEDEAVCLLPPDTTKTFLGPPPMGREYGTWRGDFGGTSGGGKADASVNGEPFVGELPFKGEFLGDLPRFESKEAFLDGLPFSCRTGETSFDLPLLTATSPFRTLLLSMAAGGGVEDCCMLVPASSPLPFSP